MKVGRGEIWIAQLDPAPGSEMGKRRPVLVVSNDIANEVSNAVTVLPISSNVDKIYPFEVAAGPEVGLDQESKIKANQIRTLGKERLTRKIGTLSMAQMSAAEEAMLAHLGMM